MRTPNDMIRAARLKRGWTQSKLANICRDVTPGCTLTAQWICRIEAGERVTPGNVLMICRGLNEKPEPFLKLLPVKVKANIATPANTAVEHV